jgi:hypothetical protein
MRSGCGANFKGNPSRIPFESTTLSAESLVVGVFDASRHLSKVQANSPVQVASGKNLKLPGGSDHRMMKATVGDSAVYSCSASSPEIGCLRVRYSQSTATSASIVTRLGLGDAGRWKTRPWPAPATWMCSSTSASSNVDLFQEGKQEVDDLFNSAQASNTTSMYMWRAIGVFLTVLGVMLFLQPIQTVADLIDQFLDWFKFIPLLGGILDFFGNVVSGAVSCTIFLIALGIGLPSAFFVLALAWCVMRPLLGIPMLCVCVAAFGFTVKNMISYAEMGKEKRAKVKPM